MGKMFSAGQPTPSNTSLLVVSGTLYIHLYETFNAVVVIPYNDSATPALRIRQEAGSDALILEAHNPAAYPDPIHPESLRWVKIGTVNLEDYQQAILASNGHDVPF